ncbi:hypothetical protein U9M48_021097 [Paspalum notatum var. saurae]|uniref:Uncharacterized protein n=1 Tax=Paspalum notatum var. saurae TaxID=547442 RepID=A0AAQ3TGM9_PASNO
MTAPPQTLALAGLLLLNFLLAAAGLYLRVRRRRPQEQRPPRVPASPGPELAEAAEPPAAGAGEQEEEDAAGGGGGERQRRRRRARRKRQQQQEGGGGGDGDAAARREGKAGEEETLLPRRPQFPLASVAGALQRRINARYDDLARASEARCLTIEQVNEFVSCLVDARNELLQRYENVQRSFKIKKAMLSNHRNYRSSYDSLFEQVRRLETERDNLKKDAAVYNYLQERLQKSVPYKMIMELSAMEMEAPEISFEELLAQEKEDTAFWQRNGKPRSTSSK